MSRFMKTAFAGLEPYTPGEQPRDVRTYVKLNTNENPFPPAPGVAEAVAEAAEKLQLYCDPEATVVAQRLAQHCGVQSEQIVVGNGSDEVLNYAFMAFCDAERPAVFPDISYGFYAVWARINGVPYVEIPLRDDFSVVLEDYPAGPCVVFLANPNAPTGKALPSADIAAFARGHADALVVVDEAYVDFGAESCVPLVSQLDNIMVVQTFSKSRSFAGARFGFAVGSADVMADMRAMKYSTNPYNVNAMTQAAVIAALGAEEYTRANCSAIAQVREATAAAVRGLGFECIDSASNFLFMRHSCVDGAQLYAELKNRGVLVRHFVKPRISDYIRVTIGTQDQMDRFLLELATVVNSHCEFPERER